MFFSSFGIMWMVHKQCYTHMMLQYIANACEVIHVLIYFSSKLTYLNHSLIRF